MNENDNIISFDTEEVTALFKQAIKDQATEIVRQATRDSDVKKSIRRAFGAYADNRDSWLEKNVKRALEIVMWTTVQEVIEGSGAQGIIQQAIRAYMKTDEFITALQKQAIESITPRLDNQE